MRMLTSLDNQIIKDLVKLHETKYRRAKKSFLVEGLRCIETFLKAGSVLEDIFITEEHEQTMLQLGILEEQITILSPILMRKVSQASTPSGILGQFRLPPIPLLPTVSHGLVLAQIQDPGNMGTLIRTAVALNYTDIIVLAGSADLFSYKVIQASAGALAHANIYEIDLEELIAHKKDALLIGLIVSGGKTPAELVQQCGARKKFIMVGNEARGLTQEQIKQCDMLMTLPMPSGQIESLNAAVAGALALYLLQQF
jgi:TrmH family RNA methyltransferase